jgi:hypothetical protein|tara:strand:+ start:1462 stop:1608 length:147 start_codon:yes stop_codon:yes gene_type:complete
MLLKEVEEIEKRLNNYKYEEIPKKFIQKVNEKFDTYCYLKSLLDLKKG